MLRPCGVTLSVARFGKGRGAETPLSLIFKCMLLLGEYEVSVCPTLIQIFVAYFSVFSYTIMKGLQAAHFVESNRSPCTIPNSKHK